MERAPPARVAVTVRIIIRVSYHFAAEHRNSKRKRGCDAGIQAAKLPAWGQI
jgi:hypothetical protein